MRRVRAIPVAVEVIASTTGPGRHAGPCCNGCSETRIIDYFVLHAENRGKGAAIRTGIAQATGDVIVIQDADLEYDPADLPGLLEPILDGRADAVFGIALPGRAPPRAVLLALRRQQLLTLLSNMLTDLNLTDMETCYKMVRADLMESLPLTADRFGFEPEITARLAQSGARIYELPISYNGRTYAEGKKIGWKDGVAALFHIVRYNLFPPAGDWRRH